MSCPICLDTISQTKPNYLRLKCNHEFHFNCIMDLLNTKKEYNNKCPICREQFIKQYPQKQSQSLYKELIRLTNILYNQNQNIQLQNQVIIRLEAFVSTFVLTNLITILLVYIYNPNLPNILGFIIYIFLYMLHILTYFLNPYVTLSFAIIYITYYRRQIFNN